MARAPKIVQLFHPTGGLYQAFRHLSENHPDASWFQSDNFFRFASKWPEAEPVLLAAVKGQFRDPGKRKPGGRGVETNKKETEQDIIAGSLLGVILREPVPARLNFWPVKNLYTALTSRAIVYGGPLLEQGTRLEREMVLKELLEAFQEHAKKGSVYTQLRNFFDLSDYKPVFREMGFGWHEHMNLISDTSGVEKCWNEMSSSRRRQVRKSLDAGVSLIYDPSLAQIDAFYDLLCGLYKKKVRKPLPLREFFHALCSGSFSAVSILLEYDKKIIGGIVCPLMPGRALYEWYVCGLDREYREKDIYPSVLLTWAAMEYAAKNSIPAFDFMGLGVPGEKYGVRDFKARFGGTWVEYGRFSKVNRRFKYFLAEIIYNIYSIKK